MSMEFWTAFGSVGTFVVIAVTAIIAMIQLRHLRAANHTMILHNIFTEYEGPEFRDAFHFVRAELNAKLEDPVFRRQLRTGIVDRISHPEIIVLNWFEQLGVLYSNGAIDKSMFMFAFGNVCVDFWELLQPVIALLADPVRGNMAFQEFESATMDAKGFMERHPYWKFSAASARLPLNDRWRDVDAPVGGGATSP